MIVRDVPQVEENTCEVIRLTEKGNLNGKIARRKRGELGNRLPDVSPQDLMIWVKLNCLKSSGKLETIPPLTQRLRSSPDSSILYSLRVAKFSCRERGSVRPIKPRKDTLSHSDNVIHDCTAGSPTGREPYGDGNSIVVGGVTTTQGGRESRPQGEGS